MINPRARPCEDAAIRAVAAGPGAPTASRRWTLVAAILGSSMVYIDNTALNVALPVMQTELAAPLSAMQWIVNAYAVCLAALMLVGGSAGDRHGRRRVFMAGVVVFTLASIACGAAQDATQLIAARAIQGAGGALLVPGNLALLGAAYPENERGRAIGTWAAAAAITSALGPVFGGWLVDAISWRAIFFVNVPLALLTLAIAARRVPESRDPDAAPGQDWLGVALIAGGLGALAFGLIRSGEVGWAADVALWLVAGAALVAAFVVAERRAAAPMVPLAVFRSRAFAGVNILTLLLYSPLGGALFFLPFVLIQTRDYQAALAGAAFLPFTVIIGAFSRWSGALLDRFGARAPLIIGPLVAAAGFALFVVADPRGSYWTTYLPPMAVLGFGMAIAIAPLTATVMNAVPPARVGVASGINNAVAEVASLLAVALFGAIAIVAFGIALDGALAGATLSPEAERVVEAGRLRLAAVEIPAGLDAAEARRLKDAIDAAFLASFRLLMLIAAALAVASSLCAALTIGRAAAVADQRGRAGTDRTS